MAKDTGIVSIHGKEYQTVAYRVGKFREAHGLDLSLTTELVSRDEEVVVMKATIANGEGRVLATGHSEEYRKSSQINKTSASENAETSAIGRALAALGLGGTEFASADEVANAIHQQSKGVHKPTDGAWDGISPEKAKVLRQTADQVRVYLEESKDGQGGLFKNDRKQGNGPDYKGDITVDGTAYWISAWLKESKGGKKYMSLA